MTSARTLLFAVFAALTAPAMAGAPAAYPTKPVRLIVALAAGGPTDVVARIFAQRMSEALGQQVVVDNRPGAGGSVAGEIVAHAPADGYTLFVAANGTIAIAPNLLTKLPYNVQKDLTPVAMIGTGALTMMVNPNFPAQNMKEFIAQAKKRPGAINFGSSGQGATAHLSAEMLKMMADINIVHVPYKGAGPSLVALIAGEIEMMFTGASASLPSIRQKQVRALGVTSPKRLAVLPDVPAIAETLPGYEVSSWFAVLTTAGTPKAIIDKLNFEANKVMQNKEVIAKLEASGVEPDPMSPQQIEQKIKTETARWAKVIKATGVKAQDRM
jgi:tripartite-type tricarboxylate transporter receptor subunit TctC